MNKVTSINLNGAAFQVEEAGYDALRVYLDTASRRLEGNPDQAEILADIERAIGDKFRGLMTAHKNVITFAEVSQIVAEMGPIEDGSTASTETGSAPPFAGRGGGASAVPETKRLYRLPAGAMIAGLCNGLSAYLRVDVTVLRLTLVVIALLSIYEGNGIFSVGFWVITYGILCLVVPKAQSAQEEAAAHGGHDAPHTAQEFIRRAKAGYYEGLKTWHDRDARRQWKRKFKRDMRDWGNGFGREMRRHGEQLGSQWQGRWTFPVLNPAAWIVLPVVTLLHVALVVAWIVAVVSVLNTGAAFGHPMLATMPLWKAMIVLAVIYFLLTLPLRTLRGAILGSGYHHIPYAHPRFGAAAALARVCNAVVWVAAFGALAWLFVHHPTEFGRAIGQLSAAAERGVQAAGHWFRR